MSIFILINKNNKVLDFKYDENDLYVGKFFFEEYEKKLNIVLLNISLG